MKKRNTRQSTSPRNRAPSPRNLAFKLSPWALGLVLVIVVVSIFVRNPTHIDFGFRGAKFGADFKPAPASSDTEPNSTHVSDRKSVNSPNQRIETHGEGSPIQNDTSNSAIHVQIKDR